MNRGLLQFIFLILLAFWVFGCQGGAKTGGPSNGASNGTIDSPPNEVIVMAGESVEFSGTVTDPDKDTSLTYQWDFGGGAHSQKKDPGKVVFNAPGTYSVTFSVMDSLGISDPTPATVQVKVVLYFPADDDSSGQELWMTDGTEAGTRMVKDIHPGLIGSVPHNLTDVNGTLFFTADDWIHGSELWRTDGTETGTVLVKDIHPGMTASGSTAFTRSNGALFFVAQDGSHGYELWKSDGTEDGTVLVKDINQRTN